MPDLELPQLHLREAIPYLCAVMFYPRHPCRHQGFVEECQNTLVRRILQKRETLSVPENFVPLVVLAAKGKSLNDITQDDARHQFGQGGFPRDAMAGLILVYVLACADYGDESEPATLEGARATISEAAGLGKIRGMSRSNLVSCWTDFAPAAHLSATVLLFPDLWKWAPETGGRLAEFLAYAEALRIRGETHLTGIPKRPLLDPETTWKVPVDRFILPRIPALILPRPSLLKSTLRSFAQLRPEIG